MKRKILALTVLLLTALSFGKYNVGDICTNITWTDNNGLNTSIQDQVAEGKAVMIFWGSSG